jgi:sulfur carrier protein ThiS
MNKIFVVPAEGLIIRYPDDPRLVLPVNGAFVPNESYWMRRVNDGDVIEIKENE